MITTKELSEKAEKYFFKAVSASLKGLEIFPLVIPANKKISGTNYSELKADVYPLYQQSKAAKGKGYTVDWKEKIINGSKQKIPSKIYFETLYDLLYYSNKTKDYSKIIQSHQMLCVAFPSIIEWANENVAFLLSQHEDIAALIKVCRYFHDNKPPHNLYIRELPVEVHSKFIEDNATALKKLLDIILPSTWINSAENEFSGRYFLRKPNIYTQIRILDEALKPTIGFDELSLTLEDAAWLKWQPRNVFIIENKTCFLTFPKVKNAVAIFGEGFKSRLSKHITWLNKAELYCWFDMDPAGFEMLNTIRQYYPDSKSFLMDKTAYQSFSQFSVISPYRKIQLSYLNKEEEHLYSFLQINNRRLEQERITNEYVIKRLSDLP